jgi:HlyD family secretion protein
MKKSTWAYVIGAATAAVAALAWAFAPRPVEVEVAPVSQGRFEASIDEDGKTRLRERYLLSAPLGGLLHRITLREGDALQAGEALARLTPLLAPMLDERSLLELRARMEAARANVQRADARVEGSKVTLLQARNELQRSEQLARQGFVAATKLDTDRMTVQAAQTALDAASEERHMAGHELEQARAALSAVQQPAIGATRSFALRAPVAGQVLRVLQTSETTVSLGTPLIELGDTSRMEVVAELLTGDALLVRPGSRVIIERWGGPGELQAQVRRVEPAAFTKVSALGVEEQRVKVLIDIASPREQWRALGDGFRVGVRIVTQAQEQAVKVPVSAVFPRPEPNAGMAVFVLVGGRARLQPVEIAARNNTEVWVRSGVKPGDRVIIYPPPAVRQDGRVRARN